MSRASCCWRVVINRVQQVEVGVVYAILSLLTIGLVPVIAKPVLASYQPERFVALWSLAGAAYIFLYLALRGGLGEIFKVYSDWPRMALVGILQATAAATFFVGLRMVSAAVVAIVGRTEILASILLGSLFLGERVRRSDLPGFLLVVLGTSLASYQRGEILWLPTVLVATSGTLIASSLFTAKPVLQRVGPLRLTGISRLSGGIFFLVYSTVMHGLLLPTWSQVGSILLAAFVGPVVTFTLIYMALSRVHLWKVSLVRAGSPVSVAVYSFLLLGESLEANQILGGIFAIIGVSLLVLQKRAYVSDSDGSPYPGS